MAKKIKVELSKLHQIRDRIAKKQLIETDYPIIEAVIAEKICKYEARIERLLEKSENQSSDTSDGEEGRSKNNDHSADDTTNRSGDAVHNDDPKENDHSGSTESSENPAPGCDNSNSNDSKKKKGGKPKGVGRTGKGGYDSGEHIHHKFPTNTNLTCQKCLIKLSNYREKVTIKIVGQPSFVAEVHHIEQKRCKTCGYKLCAPTPGEDLEAGIGTDYIRTHWSACALLCFLHYFIAIPFKRIDSMHAKWGVPFSDSNQWKIVSKTDELLLPLLNALEQNAARTATSIMLDDTGSKIIDVAKQIKSDIKECLAGGGKIDDVRTGINTTGIYLTTPSGVVILYYSGRHHASEVLDKFLMLRQADGPKLNKTTDAASKNFSHQHGDKLIEAVCNTHAYLKFKAVKKKFQKDYEVAAQIYHDVYENDKHCKNKKMSPEKRRDYHKEHSLPLMNSLKEYCQDKLASRSVEPRSDLWEPISFIINQWSKLIKFCQEPGVVLDTNLVEQALILVTRFHAATFFYRTEDGAAVGDHMMSLMATAVANDVEPVAYLTHCLENHKHLAENPELYFPWVYKKRTVESSDSNFQPFYRNTTAADQKASA